MRGLSCACRRECHAAACKNPSNFFQQISPPLHSRAFNVAAFGSPLENAGCRPISPIRPIPDQSHTKSRPIPPIPPILTSKKRINYCLFRNWDWWDWWDWSAFCVGLVRDWSDLPWGGITTHFDPQSGRAQAASQQHPRRANANCANARRSVPTRTEPTRGVPKLMWRKNGRLPTVVGKSSQRTK